MEVRAEHIKPYDRQRAKTEQVREMFDAIAPAYDWLNRAMSFGIDRRWRRITVDRIAALSPRNIVDIATGTGDLAVSMARRMEDAHIDGLDLSEGMIAIGQRKVSDAGLDDRVTLTCGDCLDIPMSDASADVITVAFGVRNFEHLDRGYAEMFRVLRPGGRLFVLELSTPVNPLVRPFYRFYTRCIIPVLGRIVSKDVRAYSYLPESIAAVPQGDDMLRLINEAGFTDAAFRRMTFGVCTLYTALRP